MTAPTPPDDGLRVARGAVAALPGPNNEGVARWPERHQEIYLLAIEEALGAIDALAAHPAPTPVAGEGDGLAWEAGVRQAIEWLRADYEYGTGPAWRENGAEWIAERLTEHRREATP